MKIITHYLPLLFIFFFSTSCLKQTESISPVAPIRTLAELQRETMINVALLASGNNKLSDDVKLRFEEDSKDPSVFYLSLKYNIVNMDVFETAHIPNSFEQIGNSLLKSLARLFLKLTGSKTVDIGNIDIEIPNLNLDFLIIKSLRVKKLFVEFNEDFDASVNHKATFSFVKSLDIYKTETKNLKMFSYNKNSNQCNYKCLEFTIVDGNILDMVKKSNIISVNPIISISTIPKVSELKINGQIELQIGLKLPF